MNDILIVEKSKIKGLYNMACSEWQAKINQKYEDFIFLEEIRVEKSFLREIRQACNESQLKEFNKVFGEYLENNLFSQGNTYSKICYKICEEELTEADFKFLRKEYRKKACAQAKIQQLERYFNKGSNKNIYYPYFNIKSGDGLCFYVSGYGDGGFDGSAGFFQDRETSDFVGKTFIDIYEDLM